MDGVMANFKKGIFKYLRENKDVDYPQKYEDFWVNLEPIKGSLEAWRWFNTHPKIEPYILTAPSELNPACYSGKRIWVEKNLGEKYVNKLIITPHKNLNKGDFIVDDTLQKGVDKFEGKHFHFAYPWTWEQIIIWFKNNIK